MRYLGSVGENCRLVPRGIYILLVRIATKYTAACAQLTFLKCVYDLHVDFLVLFGDRDPKAVRSNSPDVGNDAEHGRRLARLSR